MVEREPVYRMLEGAGVFRAQPMLVPPAEALPHVIQFESTRGCSYNSCTFCGMYKGERYEERTFEEFREHVDMVWEKLRETDPKRARRVKRIFIANGNALNVESIKLNHEIQYAIKTFKENTGRLPKRLAMYGTTSNILEKSWFEMKMLGCGGFCGRCSINRFGKKIGLSVLYWGIESGSDEVLRYIRKNATQQDVIEAGYILGASRIRPSATIMLGVGGHALSRPHVEETSRVLNMIRPEFITFIGIDVLSHTAYAKRMDEEMRSGINRPLGDIETAQQLVDIIANINFQTTVACIESEKHNVGNNPIAFGSKKIKSERRRKRLVHSLESKIKKMADGVKIWMPHQDMQIVQV